MADEQMYYPYQVAAALLGAAGSDPDLRLDIERLLPRLPTPERDLLLLRAAGFSLREAGRILGIPASRRVYVRGLQRLTRWINGEEDV